MATYSWGETVVRRRYWEVRTDTSWRGAACGELEAAIFAAAKSYRQAHEFPPDYVLSDDALWVTVTDDAVVISYTTEEPPGANCAAVSGDVQEPGLDLWKQVTDILAGYMDPSSAREAASRICELTRGGSS
jgi:hypothetical protein